MTPLLNQALLSHHLLDHFPPSSVERSLAELPGCPSLPIGNLPEAPRRPARGYGTPWQPRTREVLQRAILALLLGYEGDALVCGSCSRGAGRRAWSHDRDNCLLSTRRICGGANRGVRDGVFWGGYPVSARLLRFPGRCRALPCLSWLWERPLRKWAGRRYGLWLSCSARLKNAL